MDPASRHIESCLEERRLANRRFFDAEATRTAELCHRVAERFARGGRLLAVGSSPAACSDAHHVAVEFVHPVIVGKRALPAIALAGTPGSGRAISRLVKPEDVVMRFGTGFEPGEAAQALPELHTPPGCLTIGYAGALGEWVFSVPSDDPFVRQEVSETHYHILWELVHVFFDHRGLLPGRSGKPRHDPGAAGFLYPFLAEQPSDLDAVLADVRRSVLRKAEEVDVLRGRTLHDAGADLLGARRGIRERFEAGGTALVFGNGGSATDAMDLVADFLHWPGHERPALDLAADPAILTAIGNDVGHDGVFARQVIACGRAPDIAIGISTSGNSRNVVQALEEARRRDLLTVAFVGYEGGHIAAEGLADFVFLTRSEHIPRIQEAQATAYHVLRGLIEQPDPGPRPG